MMKTKIQKLTQALPLLTYPELHLYMFPALVREKASTILGHAQEPYKHTIHFSAGFFTPSKNQGYLSLTTRKAIYLNKQFLKGGNNNE